MTNCVNVWQMVLDTLSCSLGVSRQVCWERGALSHALRTALFSIALHYSLLQRAGLAALSARKTQDKCRVDARSTWRAEKTRLVQRAIDPGTVSDARYRFTPRAIAGSRPSSGDERIIEA